MERKDQKGKDHQKQGKGEKKKKIYACRAGDTCPICQREGAVEIRREIFTPLGDGMAGGTHTFDPWEDLPLECRYCCERFKKASAVFLATRIPSKIARILFGIR